MSSIMTGRAEPLHAEPILRRISEVVMHYRLRIATVLAGALHDLPGKEGATRHVSSLDLRRFARERTPLRRGYARILMTGRRLGARVLLLRSALAALIFHLAIGRAEVGLGKRPIAGIAEPEPARLQGSAQGRLLKASALRWINPAPRLLACTAVWLKSRRRSTVWAKCLAWFLDLAYRATFVHVGEDSQIWSIGGGKWIIQGWDRLKQIPIPEAVA